MPQFHHHQGVTAEFNSSDLTQEHDLTGKSVSVSGSPRLAGHNRKETTNEHIEVAILRIPRNPLLIELCNLLHFLQE